MCAILSQGRSLRCCWAGQKCRASEEETCLAHQVLHSIMLFETQGGHDDSFDTVTSESKTLETLHKIESALPSPVDEIFHLTIAKNYPLIDGRPQNAVLQQECVFYGNLVDNIKATLHVLTKVLKGDLNATAENIHVLEEIKDSVVPVEWIKPPYQSAHSLWSFLKTLSQQVEYFRKWVFSSYPEMVWLGAFVFPKAFLTSIILERVYKDRISPRKLCLDFYPLQSISNSPKTQQMENTTLQGYISRMLGGNGVATASVEN